MTDRFRGRLGNADQPLTGRWEADLSTRSAEFEDAAGRSNWTVA